MTGADIQGVLDAIVLDLQTKGKGKSVSILMRNENNNQTVLELGSDVNGVVDAGQLAGDSRFY